jgi:hypothetical protein
MLLSVALISTSVPAKVQASWFSDLCGGIFTILSAPIWIFCQDNPTFRKNNPFRKKPWEEQASSFKQEELITQPQVPLLNPSHKQEKEITENPEDTPLSSPTVPSPIPTPEPEEDKEELATTPTPTSEPVASPTPIPTPTATQAPKPIATQSATVTPSPSPIPTPEPVVSPAPSAETTPAIPQYRGLGSQSGGKQWSWEDVFAFIGVTVLAVYNIRYATIRLTPKAEQLSAWVKYKIEDTAFRDAVEIADAKSRARQLITIDDFRTYRDKVKASYIRKYNWLIGCPIYALIGIITLVPAIPVLGPIADLVLHMPAWELNLWFAGIMHLIKWG